MLTILFIVPKNSKQIKRLVNRCFFFVAWKS